MTMGEKILNMRKARGWSQEDLADRIGVTRQAVSRWESNNAKPDADKIIAVCEIFGVSADYLLREQCAGESVQNKPAAKQTTALGDAVRGMTLRQWGGCFLLALSTLVIGVVYVLSKVYPAVWIQHTQDFTRVADGLIGFLLIHEIVWAWIAAQIGVIAGIMILFGKRLRKFFKNELEDIATLLNWNG